LKVHLWLCRVVIAVKQQTKRKNMSKLELPLEPEKKNEMKDNKPYILAVFRHIFDIFSSQMSTMMEIEALNNQSEMRNLPT